MLMMESVLKTKVKGANDHFDEFLSASARSSF